MSSPLMCTFCGFKFCEEHKSTESHQCIKTRYTEYIRKNHAANPNISKGDFRVVCDMCGFSTTKGIPIEYAGEELIQHTQIVGCSENVFLEEVNSTNTSVQIDSVSSEENSHVVSLQNTINAPQNPNEIPQNISSKKTSIVDEIVKLAALKEKGMISEQEFLYIKKELIRKIK
ncbi:MAG: AN1-type zinc finger domain-containing protein [Thaumarchaeota archaeon]|nr:AN1-type zinc finger domain-containing protein [Nitrososphaerota archaeon]